eukprot:scaffold1616_cov310-Pinguiococcus_pyrenoidosus.AAC.3
MCPDRPVKLPRCLLVPRSASRGQIGIDSCHRGELSLPGSQADRRATASARAFAEFAEVSKPFHSPSCSQQLALRAAFLRAAHPARSAPRPWKKARAISAVTKSSIHRPISGLTGSPAFSFAAVS